MLLPSCEWGHPAPLNSSPNSVVERWTGCAAPEAPSSLCSAALLRPRVLPVRLPFALRRPRTCSTALLSSGSLFGVECMPSSAQCGSV